MSTATSSSPTQKMLPRHHGTQRQFQTSTASRHKQWQELLKPQSCMCSPSYSLTHLQGHVGAFDLLFSFWGAVCPVQDTHVAPKHTNSESFVFSPDETCCQCQRGPLGSVCSTVLILYRAGMDKQDHPKPLILQWFRGERYLAVKA